MGYDFNVDEIFEIAVQLERNGAIFYRQMAKRISEARVSQLLLNFASMEEAHEKVFISMRKSLSDREREKTVFDPDEETVQYLRAFAGLFVFDDGAGDDFVLSEELSNVAKIRKVLRTAINIEWESIAFYAGMKDLVPEVLGKGKIDSIIKEEMRHVRILSENLNSLAL